MSKELENLAGIDRIPIFPLPLVLLPHEYLPLHIFESRYKIMLSDVSEGDGLIGISLFEPENEFELRPKEGSIGCVAELKEAKTYEDGRADLITIGSLRYRILEYIEEDLPYLNARIEFFEDEDSESDLINEIAGEVSDLFHRLATAAHKMSGRTGPFPDIPPAPPEKLSFLVTAAFNMQNDVKYEMLDLRSTEERLSRLRVTLRDSVSQFEDTVNIDKVARTNGHGKKKIDI